MKIITFQDALKKASGYKKHLLLGNGFSIACKPDIFTYQTLYNQADFSEMPNAKLLFEELKTSDFEVVVKSLEQAASVLNVYDTGQSHLIERFKSDAIKIKYLLIDTVANNHPARPNDISDKKYQSCCSFLSNFIDPEKNGKGSIYSMSYDLLLYWTLMYQKGQRSGKFHIDDGFNRDSSGFDESVGEASFSPEVKWQGESQSHTQNIHFLHGALHLYDKGATLQKYTWNDTGIALTDQARFSIDEGFYPLFVSEGDNESKLNKIKHSAYLHKCFRSLASNTNQKKAAFFAYGFSFSENDNHIIRMFKKNRCPFLAISIYGDPNSDENQRISRVAEDVKAARSEMNKLEVVYYDSLSARVWN